MLEAIGKRAGLPADQISGVARTTADVPIPLIEPGSEERASQIRDSRAPYRLELQSDPAEPILAIYAEAPSVGRGAAPRRLRRSSACRTTCAALARRQGFPEQELPQLRQLGAARGGITNGKATIVIGALTFVTAFALSFVVALPPRRSCVGSGGRGRASSGRRPRRASPDAPRRTGRGRRVCCRGRSLASSRCSG